VAGRRDPRAEVNVLADVALGCEMRSPGVQTHTHADRPAHERHLRRGCGRDRGLRRRKRDEERITLGVDLHAASRRECIAQQTPVLAQQLGVAVWAQLLQQLRRALDVREEQRYLTLRQIRAHAIDDAARVFQLFALARPATIRR
jgi:hypothetical protein